MISHSEQNIYIGIIFLKNVFFFASHLAVKRMVLPNIIVTVSETLYPTLLHEKMKHAIVTAFTQVVANRDQRYVMYFCMYA